MKGFAMKKIGQVGWIEKDKPVCGPLDAIVRPLAVAPCTSDVHTVWAGAIGEREDMILGHEAVGIVEEVGSLVKDFKKGDRVIAPAITPDWGMIPSQEGFAQHSSGMLGGWKFSNFKDGVFAEYFHVNEADANLCALPDSINVEEAAMLCDMIPTGFHGAELADIRFGETVCVIGIGPVGLMAVAGANLRGAGRIFAVGSRPDCVRVSKIYGATDIVNYKQGSIADQILEATNGRGVDKVIIAGGNNDTFIDAVKMVKAGGIVSNVNYLGEGDYIRIPRAEWGVGMGHKRIVGGLMPAGRARTEKLVSMLVHKKLDVSYLITHKMHGIDAIEKGIFLMKDKPADLIKPVVIF